MKITRFLSFAACMCLLVGGMRIADGFAELYSTRKHSEEYIATYAYFVRSEEYDKPSYLRPAYYKAEYFVYTYQVDGKNYEIKKDFSSRDLPPVGSYRTVYYDPKNPQMAVLDSSDYAKNDIKPGAAFLFAAFILLIIIARKGGLKEIRAVIFGR